MKKREANFIRKMEKRFSEIVRRFFPNVPFDKSYPPEKFVGVAKVKGQKPIALFVKSNQPVCYDEVVLDDSKNKSHR